MTSYMLSSHRKALLFLLLSGAVSIIWGSYIAAGSSSGLGAFKAIYYPARCLQRHIDPYNVSALQQEYAAEGGKFPLGASEESLFRRAMLTCVNLPTSFLLVMPLAILPWKIAATIWMVINASLLPLAAILIWNVASKSALKPSTLLVCLLLANAEQVLGLGNLAGIVVNLTVIAVWCFLEGRFAFAGVICLAVSLALKPHDAGFVWLYFLLAGGANRKRALQTLGVTALLALPAILWISHVAPHWLDELRANLHTLSAHGSVNDPGPDSPTFRSADTVISLQAMFSLIRDDPRFYNLASYLTCGILLLAGAIRVLRTPFSKQNAWLALAAISALSMLPVYHRPYDAKLLLLAIPACAWLWSEGGRLKWIAGLVTTLAILSTADVPATVLLVIMKSVNGGLAGVWGKLMTAFVFHPAPLVLLSTGVFYLWVYFRRTAQEKRHPVKAGGSLGRAIEAHNGAVL